MARLSGSVSILHHISGDGEGTRERGGERQLLAPTPPSAPSLGHTAAHHRPARLVVRGMRDTMEAFVPCHLAIRHSLIMVERGEERGGCSSRLVNH